MATALSILDGANFWHWGLEFGIALTVIGLVWLIMLGYSKPSKMQEQPIMPGDNYTNSGNNFGHMGPVNNFGEDQSPKLRLHRLLNSIDRRIVYEARTKSELVVRMEPHDIEALYAIISQAPGLMSIKGFGRSFPQSQISNGSLGTGNATEMQTQVILVVEAGFN